MHPSSLSCQSTHLTACQLQQQGIPKERYELSLAVAKHEEERWYKCCKSVTSTTVSSLSNGTAQRCEAPSSSSLPHQEKSKEHGSA